MPSFALWQSGLHFSHSGFSVASVILKLRNIMWIGQRRSRQDWKERLLEQVIAARSR